MLRLKERLDRVSDTYDGFKAVMISYAKKKPERYRKLMDYLDQNPDAESSDILWFVSSQDDFYEDAAPREEHGIAISKGEAYEKTGQ